MLYKIFQFPKILDKMTQNCNSGTYLSMAEVLSILKRMSTLAAGVWHNEWNYVNSVDLTVDINIWVAYVQNIK